jgi:CBS domain-containing protein
MICPRCSHDNFDGADRCANCMEPLRDRDVPQATAGFQRLLMEEPVGAVAGASPIALKPDASVAEAVLLMKQNRVGCVLVVAADRLAGIFTERDLLLKIVAAGKSFEGLRLQDVMTQSPETVEAGDSLRVALNKMSVGGFRHIPVVAEGGRVTGLVTAKDALGFLARATASK